MKLKDRIPSPHTRVVVDRHGVILSIVRPPITNTTVPVVKKATS